MKNCKCSRAKLLTEKLKKFLEADNTGYDYFLYIPDGYNVEEAQLVKVTAKQGNQVKFQILETDLDAQDFLVPTGEVDVEDCTGELAVIDGYECIKSSEFSGSHAWKLDAPTKLAVGEQGKCDNIDPHVYGTRRPATYFDPPEYPEVDFMCSATGRGKQEKSCDIDNCPNGPIYFMQFGITENLDLGELEDSAVDDYEEDIEYQKARARGWDD